MSEFDHAEETKLCALMSLRDCRHADASRFEGTETMSLRWRMRIVQESGIWVALLMADSAMQLPCRRRTCRLPRAKTEAEDEAV